MVKLFWIYIPSAAASMMLIIFSFTPSVYSQTDVTDVQTFIDSNITRNFLYSNLDNELLSANFLSKLNYLGTHDKINYYVKNYYSSAVTKLSKNFFRDLDNIKTGLGYSIWDDLTGYLNYNGMFYSDDKNIQLKGISSNLVYLSGNYDKSFNGAEINAVVNGGYKFEKQIDELNRGVSLGSDINLTSLDLSGYAIDGQLKLLLENLNPRKNTTILGRVSFDKSYSDNLAHNSFDGFFSRIRKDFYYPADIYTQQQYGVNDNIEQRTEYIAKAFDRFDYTISPKVYLYLTFNPYYRDIFKENYYVPSVSTASPSVYDTEISESDVLGDIALKFNFSDWDAQLKATYSERNEMHYLINSNRISQIFVKEKQDLESSKDNNSSFFKLNSNIYYDISSKNRFEISSSASIFRYNTPNNTDDRDELNYLVYIGHKYDNLKNLQLINSIDLNLYHTVYIYSNESANNNWNRVIRFTSKNIFTPFKQLSTANTFSVLANYTVYDFEDMISTVESYSFRQFNFKDSTNYIISKNFALDLYGEVKLYDRGELNWHEFSEKPLNYFEDRIINGVLDYFFSPKITISGGYRFYEQRRYNYVNGVKLFDSFVKTYGPIGQVKMYVQNNSYIELIASFDTYGYSNSSGTSNGNLYLNVLWNF